MRTASMAVRHQAVALLGVVERNAYLVKRYGLWELAFFIWTVANTLTVVRIPDVNLLGGFPAGDVRNPVQVGDYIELRNSGQVRRITAVAANRVTVATAFPFATVQSPIPSFWSCDILGG